MSVAELYNSLSPAKRREIDLLLLKDKMENVWLPLVNPDDPDTPTPQEQAYNSQADILLYGGAAGGGKLLSLSTIIPTTYGYTEVGSVEVGDVIFSEDGSPTTVVAVSEIETPEDSYDVEFDTGEVIRACGRHLWKTMTETDRISAFRLTDEYREKRRASRPSRAKEVSQKPWVSRTVTRLNSEREYEYKDQPDGSIRTTQEILDTLKFRGSRVNHSVAVAEPIQCERKVLPIDPYVLGLWLGDGSSNSGIIGMAHYDWEDIIDYIEDAIQSDKTEEKGRKTPYRIVRFKELTAKLRELGVLNNKHIPTEYLRGSVGQRIALLQGLADTDGTCDFRGQCEIGFSNERLLNDTWELLSSLGIKCTIRHKRLSDKNPNHKDHYRIKFVAKIPVFRLKRKLDRQKIEGLRPTVYRRYITRIEKTDPTPMRCIQVSHPSGMYLVGRSFIPTHNSALGIGLALTAHTRSLILRREAKQVLPIADEIIRIRGTREGYNGQNRAFNLDDTGQFIQLGGMQYLHDREAYQGVPYDLQVWDELTQFMEEQFRYLMAWNRSNDPSQRCRVLCTSNPPQTAEGQWVIKFWGPWLDPHHPNPALPGELRWFTTDPDGNDMEVDGPQPIEVGGDIVHPRSRSFIPSSVDDNPFLIATGYKSQLQALPEPLRSQMLKGDFTAGSEDNAWQVIPKAWVEAAMDRWREGPPNKTRMSAMGVDPARGGRDKTIIARRYGNWYDKLIALPGSETVEGSQVAAICIQHVKNGAPVFIDIIGGAGTAPYEHLKSNGVNVHAVDGRASSSSRERAGRYGFVNKRSEMWWRFREALDPDNGENVQLPYDREMMADLCAPRWSLTSSGLKVEGKGTEASDMKGQPTGIKKRLGRSPDKGDAVVYAWNEAPSREKVANRPKQANRSYNPHRWR